jgi:hypothetical protein
LRGSLANPQPAAETIGPTSRPLRRSCDRLTNATLQDRFTSVETIAQPRFWQTFHSAAPISTKPVAKIPRLTED